MGTLKGGGKPISGGSGIGVVDMLALQPRHRPELWQQ